MGEVEMQKPGWSRAPTAWHREQTPVPIAVPEPPLPQPPGPKVSPASDEAASGLARYWEPRYWPTWVFLLWLRSTAALPWPVAIKVHKLLGRAAGALLGGRRKIVRRNLEICFPELEPSQIKALMTRHFENVGVFLAEIAIAWFGCEQRLAHLFRIEGVEHLEAARAKGKGVLLYSGHFTTLEICVPIIKSLVPLFAFMFRGRNNPLLNTMQSRCRRRAAHVSVANSDVREMLRLLRQNAVVWYAPDQARIDSGKLVPFFGEPAMTSTAASRLALHSGATIVPLFFCRVPDDSGYVLRFEAPLDNLPTNDATHDTARLTAVLESFVRECPEQYFWTHRKFKGRPRALPDAYDQTTS
jgi:KDO2-lipid IV(A) lauroyltransferase